MLLSALEDQIGFSLRPTAWEQIGVAKLTSGDFLGWRPVISASSAFIDVLATTQWESQGLTDHASALPAKEQTQVRPRGENVEGEGGSRDKVILDAREECSC